MRLVHSLSIALYLILASVPSNGYCDRLEQIESEIQRLEPLVSLSDSTYYRATLSIKLPDRISVDDQDYFTPLELAQLIRKGALKKEILDYITQVSVEFESGYFNLSSKDQNWITNQQDEARKWWENIRDEKTAVERLLSRDKRLVYFTEKSLILSDENIPSPSIYIPKLQSEGWDAVASLRRMHGAGFVFHAPFMKRTHSNACRDSIRHNGVASSRDIFKKKLKELAVPEEHIDDLEKRCFVTSYGKWYAKQTAADYYHRFLNDSPANFVQSELFVEGSRLHTKYYGDLLVSALDTSKSSLNKAQRERVEGATITISDDRFTNATSLFHAFTDTANKKIQVSPMLIRAVAAQCRVHQVNARMLYDALKKEREAYMMLFRKPEDIFPGDFIKFNVWRRKSIQETKPITTISYEWEDFPEYSGPLSSVDLDVVGSFKACFKEQVVFLLSHELAHIYLPNASENERDCSVVNNLFRDEYLLFGKEGREFLSVIMFNAVTEQDFALWGWNESTAKKIKERFSELDNCLIE